MITAREIERRLKEIVTDLEQNMSVQESARPDQLPLDEELTQIREFVDVGELGLAYESIVCMVEAHNLRVSGRSATALLEIALCFGYKTERPEDKMFDRRAP